MKTHKHTASSPPERELQMEEVKPDSSVEHCFRRGKFIRAVRAVLFHTKLIRNREKRIASGSMRRSSSGFSFRKQYHDEHVPKPDLSNSASTRSASPLVSQKKREEQSGGKEDGGRRRRQSGGSIMIGLVLILMSLGLTIMWGRVWAIALNGIWLACIPKKCVLKLGSDDDEVESEKAEESAKVARRRVIMEGLLDRSHHHQLHQCCMQQKL